MGENNNYIEQISERLCGFIANEKPAQICVSVIVPCYNVQEYLEKCLDSLVKQTLKNLEIICVDDGSSDSTLEILNAYQTLDKRIKVLSQPNKKQGAARNLGLNNAVGEYIGFIDSDDWVDLNYFEKLYNTAKKYDSDITLADYVRIGNGKTKKRLNIESEAIYKTTEEKFKICKQAKNPCPTNKIYKKSLLDENKIIFPEGVYNEDKIFTCKAVYFANSVVSVPDIYYYYFRRPHSTVKTKNKKNIQDKITSQKEVLKFLRENKVQLKDDDFWAIKKEYKLFGIKLLTIKENISFEKYLLFDFIPYKMINLNKIGVI